MYAIFKVESNNSRDNGGAAPTLNGSSLNDSKLFQKQKSKFKFFQNFKKIQTNLTRWPQNHNSHQPTKRISRQRRRQRCRQIRVFRDFRCILLSFTRFLLWFWFVVSLLRLQRLTLPCLASTVFMRQFLLCDTAP